MSTSTDSSPPTIRRLQFKAGAEADALTEAELKLTQSVITFARHAQTGRVHYSRDLRRHPVRSGAAGARRRPEEDRDVDQHGRRARQLPPAARRLQGAPGQACRGAQDAPTALRAHPRRSDAEVRQGQEGHRGPDGGPPRAGAARQARRRRRRREQDLRQGAGRRGDQVPEVQQAAGQRPAQRRRRSTRSTARAATATPTSSSPTWSAGAGCRATSARPT